MLFLWKTCGQDSAAVLQDVPPTMFPICIEEKVRDDDKESRKLEEGKNNVRGIGGTVETASTTPNGSVLKYILLSLINCRISKAAFLFI
jgi:hypothetical protein